MAHEKDHKAHLSPSEDRYISPKQLSEIIQVSTQTIYEMVKRGEGPRARHFGRQIRFAMTDVNEWLDKA